MFTCAAEEGSFESSCYIQMMTDYSDDHSNDYSNDYANDYSNDYPNDNIIIIIFRCLLVQQRKDHLVEDGMLCSTIIYAFIEDKHKC